MNHSMMLPFVWTAVLAGHPALGETFYFDQKPPGTEVKIFAPGVISAPGRFQQCVTFSADGREYCYGVTDSKNWNYESILCTRVQADGQAATETPAFVRNFRFQKDKFIGEPMLSADATQLFFVANYPPDIWVATRRTNEAWGEAVKLPAPINSDAAEWSPCAAASGALYFCSTRNRSEGDGRIYRCPKVNGAFKEPELLKGEFNEEAAGDPALSPDEKTLVFASTRQGGQGHNDLYISYRQPDGTWSKGYNLGPQVNTAGEELGPRISPDGKYLFFYRRDQWKDATHSDIYWTELSPFLSFK